MGHSFCSINIHNILCGTLQFTSIVLNCVNMLKNMFNIPFMKFQTQQKSPQHNPQTLHCHNRLER